MLSPWAWQYKSSVKRPFWYLLQRRVLERVACFHATAVPEVEDIRRLGFAQPVAVIPNGVEIPQLPTALVRKNRVVFLSRVHEKKGLHFLLPAWRSIQEDFRDWELCIAGRLENVYGQRMVRYADESGVERVRFLGEVLGEHKRDLLASSRLFVLPSLSENFGIAVAEALAHGTPVITTTETPWQNLADKGVGWSIPANRSALEGSLRQAMTLSTVELEVMGETGRAWMAKDYSWQQVGAQMAAVYRWVLDTGPRPDCVHL
jgi:glycosyltransferase involved in cell wall biosynthesis